MVYDLKTATITTWLQFLRALMPPSGMLLVGAGVGTSPLVQLLKQWEEPNTILVEGDELQYQHLKRNLKHFESWHIHNVVVAPNKESVTFYRASNTSESGLINPEQLQGIWPNLRLKQNSIHGGVTVSDVINGAEYPISWLMLDCLPAGSMLRSIGDALDEIDLIMLRVLIHESIALESGNSHEDIKFWLQEQGFRILAVLPERHPALAQVLYVRGLQYQRSIYTQQKYRIDQLTDVQDEQIKFASELQAQIKMIKIEKEKLEQENSELISRVAETQNHLQKQESECKEIVLRQQFMREELGKAETQIDLIKQLLLREPGL